MLVEQLRTRHQNNAVFIWIPKNAGSSLVSALNAPKLKSLNLVKYRFAQKGIVTFGHMDYAKLVEEKFVSNAFDESAFKFAFSRNPYDRAVSLFFYFKKVKAIPQIESFLTFCRRLKEDGCEPIGLYNLDGLSQCNPQTRWIENIKLEYIGKVETIEADTNHIFDSLGLKPPAQVPRKNITSHKKYIDYYCHESKSIVEDIYREDFIRFGYPIEDFLSIPRNQAGLSS